MNTSRPDMGRREGLDGRAAVMSDLTAEEQKNVRTALRFLRARIGGNMELAKVLHFAPDTIRQSCGSKGTISPLMAFRVARFVGMGVDDVLTGKFPAPVRVRIVGIALWGRSRRCRAYVDANGLLITRCPIYPSAPRYWACLERVHPTLYRVENGGSTIHK
jgi:hypothetical protein